MKQTLYLQLWHGNYRVRKPVPKHLIELVGKGQYITKTVGTANFAEAKRRAPAVLAEFETIFAEAAKKIGPMEWGWVAAQGDPLTYFDEEAGQLRTIEFPPGIVRGMVPVGTLPPGFRRLDPNEFPPLKNSPENPVPIGPVPFGTIIAAWGRSEAKPAKPTIRAHTSKANRLIAHLGFDDMARITPERMIGYKDHLLTTDLDHATIGNHLSALHTLFRYARRNRKITTDPMAELVFKAKSDGRAKRMPFSRTDRTLVLQHARQSANPTIKWSNLLSGFSGMRLAEIVEAHSRDVEIIDGMPVFHVRLDNRPPEMSIKNAVSLRTLPIHSTVLAEGFLDYVESVGDGPLFPGVSIDHDGRRATNASRVISEWLRDVVGITDPRLVFHSHRHSVKSILRNHESQPRDDIVNKILGHIGGKDDSGRDQGAATAADGYGIFQLRAMQRIIELIPHDREKEVAIAA